MKESVGYTVTLNIVITFVIITFAFLSGAIIYYKNYKVGNIMVNAIEKYEGYNKLSKAEIDSKMITLGYNRGSISCSKKHNDCSLIKSVDGKDINPSNEGYCIYECDDAEYYYYIIKSNMNINVPIINSLLRLPIYSTTNRMYNFSK